jgi:hypothetical protein
MTLLIINIFACFSLTLTPSLREGELLSFDLRSSVAARFADRLATIHPLLGGEGRVEGGPLTV